METRCPGWHPPHCPNAKCNYHHDITTAWRYKRRGFYYRNASPHRIRRYSCLHCNRNFSSQTFSTSYWLKRPRLLEPIFMMAVSCAGNRQISRALDCAPSTVALQLSRLGRHCLLFHWREVKAMIFTDVVVDGFETFEWSQYFPYHHNVAVDAQTGFFIYHTDSEMRRKGRMTPHQKRQRVLLEKRHGRPDPKAIEKGVRSLLATVTNNSPTIRIRSDDHKAYPRAMRPMISRISHQITSSKRYRNHQNPLWEVNRLDLMIRHSTAAHKRETIAFGKRRQSSAEKLSIMLVWYNYIKRRWEKGENQSAAMLLGVHKTMLKPRDILRSRLFRARVKMPDTWSRYYNAEVETRAIANNRLHQLRYAY